MMRSIDRQRARALSALDAAELRRLEAVHTDAPYTRALVRAALQLRNSDGSPRLFNLGRTFVAQLEPASAN